MIIRYIKFDTFTPAAERGIPVTRVISRMTLQQILARAVGEDIIMNESNVVDFEDDGQKVVLYALKFSFLSYNRIKVDVDYIPRISINLGFSPSYSVFCKFRLL